MKDLKMDFIQNFTVPGTAPELKLASYIYAVQV